MGRRAHGTAHCIVRVSVLAFHDAAMEVGTNFVAKLEPFLLMSKGAKGAAAAKLVQDATSAPGVFVFAELLEMPNVQEVRCARARLTYRQRGQSLMIKIARDE